MMGLAICIILSEWVASTNIDRHLWRKSICVRSHVQRIVLRHLVAAFFVASLAFFTLFSWFRSLRRFRQVNHIIALIIDQGDRRFDSA